MSYGDFIDATAIRIDDLPPRRRAAVFWLAGTALWAGLSESEVAGSTGWFDEASDLAVDFIVDGRVGDRLGSVWEQALQPTGLDATQHLNSAVICMSSPLAIAIEPDKRAGPWIEHALFPMIQKASLDLLEDIAFPDDGELEEVFADERVQAAAEYCMSICARLEDAPVLDRRLLDELLGGADVLIGETGR